MESASQTSKSLTDTTNVIHSAETYNSLASSDIKSVGEISKNVIAGKDDVDVEMSVTLTDATNKIK